MFQDLPRIVPAQPSDLAILTQCAAADGHSVIAPTWMVSKGSQIVGAIGLTPAVHIWLDTQRVRVRDSVMVMNFFENILAQQQSIICVPCMKNSPIHPFMEKAGYVNAGEGTIFLKNLLPKE